MKKILLLVTALSCLLSISSYAGENENEETVIASGRLGMDQGWYPPYDFEGYHLAYMPAPTAHCSWSFTDKGTLTIGDGITEVCRIICLLFFTIHIIGI